MKKVIDDNGVPIPGLFKSAAGVLVVDDPTGYAKYKQQRKIYTDQQNRLEALGDEVNQLKLIVEKILNGNITNPKSTD